MRRGLPRERSAWAVVVAVVLATAVWRVLLVAAGPDPDSDAYGHHVIARHLLEHPSDHGVHWVWLPLFHWLQVPFIALGGTMQILRYVNVAIWAALPLVLFAYLRASRSPTPPATAALAAVLGAVCPIGMQMGTTAQPEPLFALVVLGFAFAFEQRRYLPAAFLATVAVLLRYEAWAVVAFVAAALVLGQRRGLRPALSVILPAAAVLGWALLRWPIDGRFFGFVLDTRKFANDALAATSSFEAGWAAALRDSLYYPYDVARRVYGLTIILAPLGLWRLGRRHPWLALSGAACLAFVTLVWLMRGSLGLDRHFVSIIPLYAVAIASGAEVAAELIHRLRRRIERSVAFGVVALVSIAPVAWGLWVWMGHWRGAIEGGYRDRLAVAAYLRTLPSDQRIFCDEATVEILSELDRRRFERRSIDRRDTRAKIDAAAAAGDTFVVSWIGKLAPLRERGAIVFRPEGASDDQGLAVLHLAP
jgi:hypothetical protein